MHSFLLLQADSTEHRILPSSPALYKAGVHTEYGYPFSSTLYSLSSIRPSLAIAGTRTPSCLFEGYNRAIPHRNYNSCPPYSTDRHREGTIPTTHSLGCWHGRRIASTIVANIAFLLIFIARHVLPESPDRCARACLLYSTPKGAPGYN